MIGLMLLNHNKLSIILASMFWNETTGVGDSIIQVEHQLGMGLSITLKAWVVVGSQWSEHQQLKQEALGSIPGGCPGFFFLQLLTSIDGPDEGSVVL